MGKWNNFFLQRMGEDSNSQEYPVCESVETWGMWCKDIPFKLCEKVKEPAKRTWPDEDGDDEFIPEGGLLLEAYSMKVEFGCKAKDDTTNNLSATSIVRQHVGEFLSYLKESGMMKMYSSYTGIGRQNVLLESYGEGTFKEADGEAFVIFEVSSKVNDPATQITLTTS